MAKILVIDDARKARDDLEIYLSAIGLEVKVAENREIGLAFFRGFRPDVVL